MNNIKKLALGLLVAACAFGFSAFTSKTAVKKTNYFYRYQPTSYTELEVKDYTNYIRSEEPCDDGEHVCGVYLTTDNPASNPNSGEFNLLRDDIWQSELDNTSAIEDVIVMKE